MARNNIITAAILASGNGSNAENILRHAQKYPDRIKIPLVICNNPDAPVIRRSRSLNTPCEVIVRKESKTAHEEAVLKTLRGHDIDWIFLAGYMAILSPAFIGAYKGKIINIHPSLLPQFPGKDGYGDAFRAGVTTSGVTLHYVDEGVDTGPIIAQKSFARLRGDTLETFRARGMEIEYQLYREFISGLANGLIGKACA